MRGLTEQLKVEKKKRRKLQTKHPLPNKELSIDRQIEVLKAYVSVSNAGKTPVGYKDIAKLGYNAKRVSSCNSFFVDVGFIKKVEKERGKFLPSNELIEFKNKSTWNLDEAKEYLKPLVESSWFGELAKKILDIKGSVSQVDLIKSFGSESGAEKDQELNLKRLIEYLEYFNVIKKDDSGNYSIVKARRELRKLPERTKETLKPTEQLKIGEIPVRLDIQITDKTDVTELKKKILAVKKLLKEI